jgi:hypothetical protein
MSVEHCGESCASAQSEFCNAGREGESRRASLDQTTGHGCPHASVVPFGGRGFGDTLFLPNDFDRVLGASSGLPCARGASRVPSDFIPAQERKMKIGILTGGGDCPGLNAVIRAVVRKGIFHYSDQFVGFLEGWRGLVEDKSMVLDLDAVSGILPRGGTILRTSPRSRSTKSMGSSRSEAMTRCRSPRNFTSAA